MKWRIAIVAWICLCLGLSLAFPQSNIIGGGLYGDTKSGFSLCSGTVISLTSPNDLTNAAWIGIGSPTVTANTQTDPLGGSTAGSITATGTGTTTIRQSTSAVINTTYEISGYFKNTVTPVWLFLQFSDLTANAFGNYFNFSTGAVGSSSVAGGGSVTCAKAAAAGQSYWHWSMAGSTTAITGSLSFVINFASANGTLGATTNQAFNYYTIGP